jgi:hypothetical protein
MPMAVQPILTWEEAVERGQQVVVGSGAELDDDQPGGRMRHEHGQKPVAVVRRLGREARAVPGQIDQPTTAPSANGQLPGVYGKMFRMASRRRPMPPPAGADS